MIDLLTKIKDLFHTTGLMDFSCIVVDGVTLESHGDNIIGLISQADWNWIQNPANDDCW